MNIWFLSPNGQPAGPRARVYNIARRLVARGESVTVFCKSHFHGTSYNRLHSTKKYSIERLDGLTVVWINSGVYSGNGIGRLLSELKFCLRAYSQATKNRELDLPDVIVGDSVTPINSAFAALIARKLKCRFVHQIRDVWPDALVADGSITYKGATYWFFRLLECFSYQSCDWICTALPNVANHVEEAGGDPARITYIRNGTDLQQTDYEAPRLGRGGRFNITYVGTISFAHDVLSVVEGLALLVQRRPDVLITLNIYGDGVKRAECERAVETLGLHNVYFHGMVPKQKVPAVLTRADLLVIAILESDAYQFGANLNKMYDYFAAGRPVLLSGRIPNDDVQSACCGVSVPGQSPQLLSEAMEKIINLSFDQRTQLGLNARRYAEEHYDVDVLAARFHDMLRQLLSLGLS